MATYLQGVTDYIPDYQPFQPDLNFYANLLQTKQTQYDTNWNQLNNLYGQLYGADLTHDLNIKKKDELLKQIDFNLKRVSGLDLSLEQNVNQAMQVFRPFYEDKYLIKDMAWTKNWKNTYADADALKNSSDPKQSSKWHAEGIRGLEYRRQMFKDATLDETLMMGDAKYTPKVEVLKEYMDFAKKYDIGMVTQTPDGMYLVRKKNGEQLLPGLQQIFWAQYGNNQAMQDYYRELSFVERMDYATQNAEKFGGNKLEAEKDYLKNKYNWLKNVVASNQVKASDEKNTAENLVAGVQNDIRQGNVNPQQGTYEEELNKLLGVTTEVEKVTSDVNSKLNDKVNSSIESTNDELLSNIELARLKVDAGYASYKAGVDIQNAAGSYAYSNYEIEYKPNAVAIAQFKEAQANTRLQTAHKMKLAEADYQEQLKRITKYQDEMVANGRAYRKADGTIELDPTYNGYEQIITGNLDSGQSAGDQIQFDKLNQQIIDEVITGKVGPGVESMMQYINNLVNNPSGAKLTNQQLGQIVGHFRIGDPTIDKIVNEGKNYPDQTKAKQIWNQIYNEYKNGDKTKFAKDVTKFGDIYHLNWYLKEWNKRHPGSELVQNYNKKSEIYDLEIYGRRHEAMEITRAENAKKIQDKLKENIQFQAKKLNNQGYKVSNDQVNNAVKVVMNEYIASGYNWDAVRQNAGNIDKLVSEQLGANFIKSTESARDRSWWEYIPAVYTAESIYDAATGNRKNVASSWINDILDKSYIELASDKNPDKGLKLFVEDVSRSGDMVSLSSKTQMVKVDSDYAGDFGYQAAKQAIQNALDLPMGDDTKFKFAFGNTIPTNADGEVDYSQDGLDDKLAKSLLQTLYTKMGQKGTPDFMLGTSRVAMENSKLGSTTFNIPRSIVEEVMKSVEGEYTPQQLAQMTDKIVQNGITAIAPHEYWTHSLWNKSTPTASEIILNTRPLEYESPQKGGKYIINKVNGVPGKDYDILFELRAIGSDGNPIIRTLPMDPKISGQTIDQIEQTMWNAIVEMDKKNLETFRMFHRNNNTEALTNAMKPEHFGGANPNAYWK